MSLINKAELKRFLLDRAKTMRPGHKFTRVSEEALEYLNSHIHNAAVELIRRHPSKGVTIKP